MTIRRPILRYHGGKWKLADWIISHFPQHRIYVEPFGGGASVLLKKPRSYAEVYNDLDGEIVTLFRVARDQGEDLERALKLTPYARDEFDLSFQPADDPLEQARRTVIRSFMGFGSTMTRQNRDGTIMRTGFRSNSSRSGTTPAHDWAHYPDALPAILERLQGVVIENRNAMEVMAAHDSNETLHYVDPPYLPETRAESSRDRGYRLEMDVQQHVDLLTFLSGLKGTVVLSGYRNELYDTTLSVWKRIDRQALADGARRRVESLWINRAAVQGCLLDGGAA